MSLRRPRRTKMAAAPSSGSAEPRPRRRETKGPAEAGKTRQCPCSVGGPPRSHQEKCKSKSAGGEGRRGGENVR
ncbi:hypothetical protein NDU88_004215 [Pleurodeles waltl]|uniref:Uncharacterized protein n=1 Tax=Pleurodeles waltl TaxID=8319 RepID=A0AAV7SI49_PLEWA|nr:hypothetical protein NDU88_004215 [Pleurodeles waltl]